MSRPRAALLSPSVVCALCAGVALASCEPLSCQGRVTDNVQAIVQEDVPALSPRCPDGDLDGDVDVTNQAELDTLLGCNTIRGSLLIHDSDDIVDLSALAALQRLDSGYFFAFSNRALTSIILPGLTNLDDGFSAIDNPELTQINVPALPAIKGDLTLRNNPRLQQIRFPLVTRVQNAVAVISGVSKLISIGNVILGELPSLTTMDRAFPRLESIDGSLEFFATGLRNFRGLEKLKEIRNVGGAATVRTKFRADALNPGLAVGIDFDNQFNIVPAGNPVLENFAGLESLTTINGDVVVAFNSGLRDFTGLEDIKTIAAGENPASLYVFENDRLTSFRGFDGDGDDDGDGDGLSHITGSLFVGVFFDRFGQPIAGGNDALVDLDGLDQLAVIGGAAPIGGLPRGLVIGFNEAFENFEGLDRLVTLSGDLLLVGSQQIRDLKGLRALDTIGGNLVLGQLLRRDGQPFDPQEQVESLQLKDLGFPPDAAGVLRPTPRDPGIKFDPDGGRRGFDALTTIQGDLVVAFSDLADLHLADPESTALTTIGGRVILYGNAAPENLDGLQTVQDLGGLIVNFVVDGRGQLAPMPSDDFQSFEGLSLDRLGLGGLHLGIDENLDDAALATLPPWDEIEGSVTLARVDGRRRVGPSSLASFSATVIGGDLVVCAVRNNDGSTLEGDLDQLTSLSLDGVGVVGGDVVLSSCSALEEVTAGFTDIGGSLELLGLPALQSVEGLDRLLRVGAFFAHELPELSVLSLPALESVQGNFEVVNVPVLETLDLGVQQVEGTLRLVGLHELENVDGLGALVHVDGDLELIDCESLENTTGLDALETVGGDMRLRRLDNITNQARADGRADLSFASLTRVGGLELSEMGDLEDLAGLQTLQLVGFDDADNLVGSGRLVIERNPVLRSLFGLQGLTKVGRGITLAENQALASFRFDDDDQDREPDRDDEDGVDDEPSDPDDIAESGFVETLLEVGQPVRDGDVLIGGATGMIAVTGNPLLDQAAFLDEVVDNLLDYEGFLSFCGNEGSTDDDDDDPRTIFFETCPTR
jgi:hypothetical protein